MPDALTRRILKHVTDRRYRPRRILDLAQDLGIEQDELDDFKKAVEELVESGRLVLNSENAVTLPPMGPEMIGKFRLNRRGFGFIEPEDPNQHRDLFVPPSRTANALTGDRVRARVQVEPGRRGGGRSYVGQIVEILQRSDNRYVGNLTKKGSQWVVEVDGSLLPGPLVVRDVEAKNASEGSKVVVELLKAPEGDTLGEAVISEVLGEAGLPDVETQGVMKAYGLEEAFESDVLEQAREAAAKLQKEGIPEDRTDLTGLFTVTIDPPDAKDYDDAISLEILDPSDPGNPEGAAYELGIHIADVSHFVPLGSALDEEAYRRGNSAYLPRRVIPMLPELLSNGVCSLQEGVNRYTKSAFMRYDKDGQVLGRRFARSVIRSDKRLTYLEAQALIDGDVREAYKHAKTEPRYEPPLMEKLAAMNTLAEAIRARRLQAGMIVLDLPEVELVYDEAGNVKDAQPEDDAFTHKIIEMFMVEANEAVASLFDRLEIPMIRRVHPDPATHDLNELRMFARVAGYNVPAHPSRKQLQELLEAVRGHPAQQAVHLAVLQTLSKAEYSPALVGHFALASEHYTHFTSPIRRYPDLIVHRALDVYLTCHPEHETKMLPGGRAFKRLQQTMAEDHACPDETKLAQMGKHCSNTERNAESAENDLRTFLVLELLAEHMGDDYHGTVTGVSADSLWIQLNKYLVDGQVRASDLGGRGERWQLNRLTGAMVNTKSGRTISIGDEFVVRIANVDSRRRKLDLVIVGDPKQPEGEQGAPKKRRQPAGARAAHKKTLGMKHKRRGDASSPGGRSKPGSGKRGKR